jgi:amidohydrolase
MEWSFLMSSSVLDGLDPLLPSVVAFYLDLHANPELSGSERRTAARLTSRLEGAGCEVTGGIGGHGLAGVLRNGDGPLVMLRAELDALPIEEKTGLPYASTVRDPFPVMHACGHDVHIAAAAGAAALLARATERWRGTLVVVGQPAEETLSGARAMLDDGLYERIGRPDLVLAQHTAPLPAGMVAHARGPAMAGSITMTVVIHGRGGHAAMPHLTIDPVLTAAATVLRLNALVARETSPAEAVVLTVGSIQAGNSANVVPDKAVLGVTVRGFSPAVIDRMADAVRRVVRAECAASGCVQDPEMTVTSRSPVTISDPVAAAAVYRAHTDLFGTQRVGECPPSMATEDFPHFAHGGDIPVVYWLLGVTGRGQWAAAAGTGAEKLAAVPPNHSPLFAPDVRTSLHTGISALVVAALAKLAPDG